MGVIFCQPLSARAGAFLPLPGSRRSSFFAIVLTPFPSFMRKKHQRGPLPALMLFAWMIRLYSSPHYRNIRSFCQD